MRPPAETILEAYRPYLNKLMGPNGAGSADVLRLRPGAENYGPLRAKFLSEHTHTEDEDPVSSCTGLVRSWMHVDGRVYDAHCTAGDLIAVPANIRHWFDAGTEAPFHGAAGVHGTRPAGCRTTRAMRSASVFPVA